MATLPDRLFHPGGRRCPIFLLLAVPALLAALLPARTPDKFPGLSEHWHYYRSPHFEEYSANDDYSSRRVLEHLEIIRAVFLDDLKLRETLPQPLTIFNFHSDQDFRGYLPPDFAANDSMIGYCANQADRTTVILAPVDDEDEARVLVYSEFIEYLFQTTEQDPARWFRTGIAQVYSTLREEHGSVVLGEPATGWQQELKFDDLFPLEQFFGMSNDSETLADQEKLKTYSAQAWAFLHYCRFGTATLPKEKLEQFLHLAGERRNQGDPERVRRACVDLLGCDYPELLKRLHRYIFSGDYGSVRLPRPKIAGPDTYVRRDVPGEEMMVRLAELSLRINRDPRAKLALLQEVDRNPGEARLQEALGNDALADGDEIGVRERWGKAVSLGTENPAIYHQLGEIESRRWFQSFDLYFRLPSDRAAELRDLLQRSIKGSPDQAGAYEMLAWVESAAPQVDVAHVNLVQEHFRQLTNKANTLLALALIRLRLNDLTGARSMLDGLQKTRRNENDERGAAIIRREIDRRAALPPAPEPSTVPAAAPSPPRGN